MATIASISIIIPTFNRRDFIIRSVRSALDQADPSVEIIVVDDGSTDDTSALVSAQFGSNIKYHRLASNMGRCYARNAGIQLANSDWICFLDSDDIYLPNRISDLRNCILKHPEILAFACEQTFDGNPRKYLNKKHLTQEVFSFTDFIRDNPISLNQLAVHKSIIPKFPSQRLVNSEDLYFLRTLSYKTPILKFNRIGVDVTEHSSRSVNITDVHSFVNNNITGAKLICKELPLTKSTKKRIYSFTYLLAANILLSKTNDKTRAWKYFRKSFVPSIMARRTFYSALVKFFI